ncbi:MAG: BMC domain-containing protein [Candidatus Latescibacteria bacterium]|nr:BMC domain-containing protein [Candidatus Latescibacterota bacterium]
MTALGMIETLGVIGTTEAADAMVKSALVTIEKYEKIGAGYTTTLVRGDVGAVQAAVEAGANAAQRVGRLVAVHIIPNLDPQVDAVIFQKPE